MALYILFVSLVLIHVSMMMPFSGSFHLIIVAVCSDYDGRTPLHYAAEGGSFKCMSILLANFPEAVNVGDSERVKHVNC